MKPGGENSRGALGERAHSPWAVSDLSDPEGLIRFALKAQIRRLGIEQKKISELEGVDESTLSRYLNAQTNRIRPESLEKIDSLLVASAMGRGVATTGGLATFARRVRGTADPVAPAATIPPGWTADVLFEASEDDLHNLVQGSALLTMFNAGDRVGLRARDLRQARERELRQTLRGLCHVAQEPPTSRTFEAQRLVAGLGMYAFDLAWEEMARSLEGDMLGFRVWRTVTKMVQSVADRPNLGDYVGRTLPSRVRGLLASGDRLRDLSAFPARSLDMETAISIPDSWIATTDWAGDALFRRAAGTKGTVRERATSAHGLINSELTGRRRAARGLVDEFRQEATTRGADPSAGGYAWAASTLQAHLDREILPQHGWPLSDEPWRAAVERATAALAALQMHSDLLPGVQQLFQHVILQNDGVLRRTAIDTVVAGNASEYVAHALGLLLDDYETPLWLRVRAIFALGFLRHRTIEVKDTLVRAAHKSFKAMLESPSLSAGVEMHDVLFALGDCLGARSPHAPRLATGAVIETGDIFEYLIKHVASGAPRESCQNRELYANRFLDRALVYALRYLDHEGKFVDLASQHLHLDAPATTFLAGYRRRFSTPRQKD